MTICKGEVKKTPSHKNSMITYIKRGKEEKMYVYSLQGCRLLGKTNFTEKGCVLDQRIFLFPSSASYVLCTGKYENFTTYRH